MKLLTFVELPLFANKVDRRLDEVSFVEFQEYLMAYPNAGDVIPHAWLPQSTLGRQRAWQARWFASHIFLSGSGWQDLLNGHLRQKRDGKLTSLLHSQTSRGN